MDSGPYCLVCAEIFRQRKIKRTWERVYLTESVYKVVLQKSIRAQICQLILYLNNKG